jgi:hypothetical protein
LLRQRPPDRTVSASERSEVIAGVLKELVKSYVYPEKAKDMEAAVRARQEKGEYDKITSAAELARTLTDHLREVSHDKHLHVDYVPALRGGPGPRPGPMNREQMAKRAAAQNYGFKKVERLEGNVGYLELEGFMPAEMAAETAAAAMSFLANTDALIIDLRRNGGGTPTMVAFLCSYFFDGPPVHLNDLYWRPQDSTHQWWTLPHVPGRRYLGKEVYLLTSKRTFSAAEEFAYDLQCLKRAKVIGETTGGGAHPGGGHRINEHFMMFVPTGRAINPITNTNWEGTGVKPDVEVPAEKALETAHRLAREKLRQGQKEEKTAPRVEPGRGPEQAPMKDPHPVEAAEAILNAFDKYRVVALGEAHGLQEEHNFIQALLRNPAFAAKVNDIVVECGNALYQDILDRYIAGEDVPLAEVRQVWRDTTQSPLGHWNALVYEQLFTTVREVNKKLPAEKRLRVLAGDPPIDWKKVKSRNDAEPFFRQRDPHFASVVEQQVLAKNRKALLIIGTGHLFKARPRVTPGANAGGPLPEPAPGTRRGTVTTLLEESYPGSTLVLTPHMGFGTLTPEFAHLNGELEPRMAAWPKPSLVLIKDTWLGALESAAIFPGMIGPDGQRRNPYEGLKLADMVDAYLYFGPQNSLTRSKPSEAFKDEAYVKELSRRSQIMFGQPFDPQRPGMMVLKPNARTPMLPIKRAPQSAQPPGALRFGLTLLMLLKQKSVQDELKLTEAQVVVAEEAAKKEMEAFNELLSVATEEYAKRWKELSKESDRLAAKILNPGQAKRLRQISLQVQGPRVFIDPQLSQDLRLTEDQKQQIEKIVEETDQQMRQLFEPGRMFVEAKTLEELTTNAKDKILKLLTAGQRTKWKEMTGERFAGPISHGQPGIRRVRVGP